MDEKKRAAPRAAIATLAGLINGLIGTGGGMLLVLGLRALYPDREREVMAITTAAVLSFSLLSILLYSTSGNLTLSAALPSILPALLGGLFGALLLGRIRMGALDGIFAALLILSGLRLLTGGGQ